MGKVIGIDLGTTNSVVAAFTGRRPSVVESFAGERTMPSMVSFLEDGKRAIGHAAMKCQVTNPEHTIYSIKRFMGRRHSEVDREEKLVPYEVVGKPQEFVQVRIGKKLYTPQQVSALILQELKAQAEGFLGEPVDGAVITVPAYFNDAQRQATKDAGEIAGLQVKRIINEPTAAALAYGLDGQESRRIVIFDFGGGTFDLSALEIRGGDFKVIGVHGNTHLGGDDFDQRIIDIVADDYARNHRFDIREHPMALQRLKQAAQHAKVELSQREVANISLPFITVDGNGPKHLDYNLTKERFEAVCSDLFDDTRKACQELIWEAGGLKDVEVVLVGGSTRMPKIQEIACEVFKTDRLNKSLNPDEVVALGAAKLGGVIQGDLHNVNLMDVVSHSMGVETAGGGMSKIVAKNTPIPTSVRRVYSTPSNNQTSVPINVLEGESKEAKENRTLGLFQLKGIRRAPAGVPQIEVEFAIDADGILQVKATDKDTGKSQEIVIQGGSGLERGAKERMRRDTQEQAPKQPERAAGDLRQHAEKVLDDMKDWLEHNGEMMAQRKRIELGTVLTKLQKAVAKNNESAIRTNLKKLDELAKVHKKAG
ncbi:MAG: molecular chaperone DnaK [Phycisphaerales bacterium]|nr:molecular chaperone DnaK [Phycisphaerales bacterium]